MQTIPKPFSLLILALVMTLSGVAHADGPANSAYDFEFQAIEGHALPLAQYRGKALLVVNTASFCGFTRQYDGLQALWDEYRERGLVVLGVPSNDFGGQEPGSAEEIKEFCETNFHINFPMTRKQHVKGPEVHPLYLWLKAELGPSSVPRWNFHKYLIGRDGQPVTYLPTGVEPGSTLMTETIEKALAPTTAPVN